MAKSKSESMQIAESPDDEADAFKGSHVPPKYRGTAIDRQDMNMLGKKQVLRRQFRFSTMLGFASTVMVAWEFILVVSPFGLSDGGTPVVFWGLLLSPIVMLPVYASLAEVASMSPTAGGQYHWVSELAPPRFQRGLSYSVGWLIALGWQVFLCSVSFVVSTLILGLAKLNFPGYSILAWHETLLTIAIVVFCVLFNLFLAVRLPLIEAVVLILHVLGVFVIIIPLWVMAPRGNAHDTILHFTNDSGYSDKALASTIGIVPMIGMLIGYDCTIHMSEETKDASRTIPLVVVWAVASNALMLIVVGWTYIFCLGDLDSVLNTETGQPMIQVFYNATRNRAGTTIMVVVVIVIFISACVGQVATASRQMWSFARDKGSYTAFNAFNSLGTVSILFSYTITIGCLIWRRIFGKPLPSRRWSLGRWGLPINIISLCFTTPMLFFYVWPLYHPVTAQNMNWSSAMFFGVLIIAAIYYIFKGRHDYVGPVMHVKRQE
ncbi:hypothetical protein DV736_g3889, partial [Chaetothyriales sp. CBS 134916]